jgi:hypothetical protein
VPFNGSRSREVLSTVLRAVSLTREPARAVVHRLGCLRGISTLTGSAGTGLAVEIGDWNRFTGSTIAAFVGLVALQNRGCSRGLKAPVSSRDLAM